MEIITISKHVLNCEFDQNIYLSGGILKHPNLKFLFYYMRYYVYHREFDFNIDPFLDIVKEHIRDLKKENDINIMNKSNKIL